MARINIDNISLANPSTRTIAERKKFAGLVDDFATFTWDGVDMFNEFGAFIINEKKGSLKFYNGAPFKNEYTKPQFQNGYTNISGISFDTQKISFQIGIYWISIEDYRVLMNFLHPYKVSFLSFSFEKNYGYQCTLAEIKDSTRHVIGKETLTNDSANTSELNNTNYSKLTGSNQSGYRYYTELQLTFEVIGTQCAKSLEPYSDVLVRRTEDTNEIVYHLENNEEVVSDLAMPIQIDFTVTGIDGEIEIEGVATADYPLEPEGTLNNQAILFKLKLKNLKEEDYISLTYDSEQGLVYWSTQDKKNIISLLSTNDTGMRIVSSLDVKQFYWPGKLDHPEIEQATKNVLIRSSQEIKRLTDAEESTGIVYFRRQRTNII